MDGFDQTVNVKVIMATNRADTLDPALNSAMFCFCQILCNKMSEGMFVMLLVST
jgi:ATP-dependent Zn protease